ncbi:MAG: stage IV sporulation protein A [Angelakisella sp.]|nr:stage IV sporulation protein A [Angelakisella sp.]
MENTTIYQDISKRTEGDIYIGVVGPVRTGKSTFIKRFMETMVLPNIESQNRRDRAIDELPQSAAGKTIMTTEPKFIPEEAVKISVDSAASFNVRMIDCVGYIVPSALGYIENEQPRMVMTPWFDREIPFNMAAEIGTKKVINEHSTIGLVITTDGSISDIARGEYEEAEERVVSELKTINKPFVMLLNCVHPKSPQNRDLRTRLEEKYKVPVIAINCLEMDESDIREILTRVLYEFPVKEVAFTIPKWIMNLEKGHWLKEALYSQIKAVATDLSKISTAEATLSRLGECEHVEEMRLSDIDLGTGSVRCRLDIDNSLFYRILGEATGLDINDEESLMPCMVELAKVKTQFDKFKGALEEVSATGYGIVMPTLDELSLEEPEIVKQGGRYGVRLRASAPSIHMMKANITTEVAPIVGRPNTLCTQPFLSVMGQPMAGFLSIRLSILTPISSIVLDKVRFGEISVR